jgi:hypothetical protein
MFMKKLNLSEANLNKLKVKNEGGSQQEHVHGGTYIGERKDGKMDDKEYMYIKTAANI